MTSTPPSSKPSTCSRKAARTSASVTFGRPRVSGPSGPTEPPTRASRPLTSRASRASWAARRLSGPTRASRPQAASRNRFAPNESVSMSSAPASMYSRCAVTTSSGRIATSSSRHARWGTPLLKRSVPIPPSTRSGRAARRSRTAAAADRRMRLPSWAPRPRRQSGATRRQSSPWRRTWTRSGECSSVLVRSLSWRDPPAGEGRTVVVRLCQIGRAGPDRVRKDPSCPEGSREDSLIVQDAPARNWHLAEPLSVGCRGFNGPVPPPLLIRNSSVVRYIVPDGRPLRQARAVSAANVSRYAAAWIRRRSR